jgi:predicted DNA-binding protein YlxM (UPF0122 family)
MGKRGYRLGWHDIAMLHSRRPLKDILKSLYSKYGSMDKVANHFNISRQSLYTGMKEQNVKPEEIR